MGCKNDQKSQNHWTITICEIPNTLFKGNLEYNRSTKISTVFSTKNHNSLISKYKKPQLNVTYKFKYPPKTYIPIFTKTPEKSGGG